LKREEVVSCEVLINEKPAVALVVVGCVEGIFVAGFSDAVGYYGCRIPEKGKVFCMGSE